MRTIIKFVTLITSVSTLGGLAACSGDKTDDIFLIEGDGGAGTSTTVVLGDGGSATLAPVNNSTASLPNGSVSGIIYDGTSEKPLAGVAVSVTVNGKAYAGTSDMNGLYVIASVPATTAWVQYSLAGYADAFFAVAPTTTTVSNFGTVTNPITQVNPVGLIKTTGAFSLRILTDAGTPAAGVVARGRQQYRYVTYNSGTPSLTGAWDVTATTGADGYANFTGLLDVSTINTQGSATLSVDIAPTTVGSGNNSYSFLGANGLSYNLLALTTGTPAGGAPYFVLAGPSTALSAVQSNVDYVTNGGINSNAVAVTPVPAAGPLTIAFNQAINPATIHASLINEDGTSSTTTLAPTVSVNELSLAPSAPLTAGARYNLDLSVDAAYRTGNINASTRAYTTVAPFFVQPSAGAVSVVNVINDPIYSPATPTANTGHVVVTFSEPVGVGRGVSTNIGCAAFYEAQLNATPTLPFGGEWAPAGQSWPLQCFSTGAFDGTFNGGNYYNTGSNSGIDPTSLGNIELSPSYVSNNSGRLVRTGFASRWTMQYANGAPTATNNSVCASGVTAGTAAGQCSPPISGTKVHLVFSLASAGNQVTRANGEPLPDSLTFTLP